MNTVQNIKLTNVLNLKKFKYTKGRREGFGSGDRSLVRKVYKE